MASTRGRRNDVVQPTRSSPQIHAPRLGILRRGGLALVREHSLNANYERAHDGGLLSANRSGPTSWVVARTVHEAKKRPTALGRPPLT